MCSTSGPVSRTPETRSARPKARRRSASARQAGSGCRCAPRPGRRRAGSGSRTIVSIPCSTATIRNNSEAGARCRQPTQVRTGDARRATVKVYPAPTHIRESGRALIVVRCPESAPGAPEILRCLPPRYLVRPPRQARRPPHQARRPLRRRRTGCQCANRSSGRLSGHSALPARSQATAGNPAR
jgi:hypothetical protein